MLFLSGCAFFFYYYEHCIEVAPPRVCLCLKTEAYTYYGTNLDNMDHLNYETNHHTSEMTAVAAQLAGQMALRLAHNHLLSLDVSRYSSILARAVARVYRRINQLSKVGLTPFYALLLVFM